MNLPRTFQQVYDPVAVDETESLKEDVSNSNVNEVDLPNDCPCHHRNRPSVFLFRIAEIISAIICAWMFVIGLNWQLRADELCYEIHNFYTPASNHEIDIQYLLWQFNGTVGYPSPYAPRSFEEGPTPEIDEAWERFHARPMSVSLEVVEKSGENTDAVRLPDELGGGYLAWAEVNHQLHCLNLLRKAIYWDYYYDITRELQREPPEVYAHLDHCIEMMRQILMCNADTGLQLHHWVRGNPTPIPNSNTWHMCKDFESILDWTHRMQIPEREGYLPILPGSKIYDRQP